MFFILTVAAAEAAIARILVALSAPADINAAAGFPEGLAMSASTSPSSCAAAGRDRRRPARRQIGRAGAHWITIAGVALSCGLSLLVLKAHFVDGAAAFNGSVYTWAVVDGVRMEIGFLVDNLTALMMVVVTSVSLMVHIYTVGYMHDDPGYQRFFSYISLFTFAMLMLVMSNNPAALLRLEAGARVLSPDRLCIRGRRRSSRTSRPSSIASALRLHPGHRGAVHVHGQPGLRDDLAQAESLSGETMQVLLAALVG